MQVLIDYSWPGNIVQLQNVVQSMVVMSDNDLLVLGNIPSKILSAYFSPMEPLNKIDNQEIITSNMIGRNLEDVEIEHILKTLKLTHGNRSEAAKILQIDERTLYRKIKEHGL